MVKVSKESLEAFQSILETIDTSWQTEFNLRETVRQSFALIKKARQYKVSWDKITEILKHSSGITDGISPESIRQYYFEFSKNSDLLPQKKRKSGSNKKKSKASTSVNFVSTIEGIDSTDSDKSPSTLPKSKSEMTSDVQPALESLSASEADRPNSEPHRDSPPVKAKSDRKAKETVRSQFNLGRRGKK